MIEGRVFVVRGRVQGVGFRWWTSRAAKRLDLSGSVRNREDGSVEVRAWGKPEKLADLERQLRRGPPGAFVESFEAFAADGEAPAGDFIIAR